jgi:hypothetical protein
MLFINEQKLKILKLITEYDEMENKIKTLIEQCIGQYDNTTYKFKKETSTQQYLTLKINIKKNKQKPRNEIKEELYKLGLDEIADINKYVDERKIEITNCEKKFEHQLDKTIKSTLDTDYNKWIDILQKLLVIRAELFPKEDNTTTHKLKEGALNLVNDTRVKGTKLLDDVRVKGTNWLNTLKNTVGKGGKRKKEGKGTRKLHNKQPRVLCKQKHCKKITFNVI